ncbi:LuxR family maltose regulon positive regulatory protein [Thermosporothrix hazakensis]|uniref:LuxR family maltose regulon positive regulatory protein n=2 Tax=Thermosporothrix hazakensis TaxID=644383 RepID=A0A326UBE3_THEHA|nr:LuxR C-terminal-related transcriptional regulator [Thermosporothrix hazakensis]PZW32695.1 LuxR family maltose regulon positive regulatory protein [Thermosporothrix hazakensis]GCE50052.1 hypothetical protein KTH_49210 [Thermosporothrix hazakensis]
MLQGCETQTEAETRLHTFAGEHRPILDYFVSEVLNAQPESLQSFLLHTSMLSRLTGSLCMAVTGNPASDALLETLEQAHLFLEPLDGLWYRYHALFAEAMQHEAKRHLGEATLQAISSKASYWYEEHSMLEEAVDAALYACDFSHAATIIERFVDFNALTYIPTLHRWLQQLPFETLKQHPTLCLNYAITQFFTHFADFIHMTGRFPQTERAQFEEPLQLAQQVWQAEGNIPRLGEVFAFQSLLSSSFSGEMQQAIEYAKKALDYLDEKELAWRSTCLRIIGLAARRRGDLNEARRTITEASALSETIGNRPIARLTILLLGIVCAEQGELQQAAAYYQQVLDEARAQADPTDIGPALLCLAQLAYERNRLDEAEQQLAEANQLRSQLPEETCRRIQLLMALLEHARGQSENALERLTNLLARLQPVHAQPLYREVLTYQARIQLALSDLSAARRSYEKLRMLESTLPDYAEQEALLLARLQLVDGKAQAALDLLHTILPQATKAGRIRRAFEIQLLLSLAYAALKQPQEARQRLYSTLHQTRSEGYIRLFLDEGDALLGLLQSLFGSLREKPLLTYLRTILQAATPARQALASPPSALIEPLSPQERRVLRLLAAGHSNPEIARELVVSVNTVRTQVQSIYRKLGVSNRVAASEAARSFHLLP